MQLSDDQAVAIQFGEIAERWILGDPAGSGKTAIALKWLVEVGAERALIVVPNNIIDQWPAEAEKWTPGYRVALGTGNPNQRALARSQWLTFGGALVINYETLRGKDFPELVAAAPDALVADEAHRLKGRNAQQTKGAQAIARKAQFVCFITGTPILNHAEELFPLLQMIDPRGYRSFWRWAYLHFDVQDVYVRGRNFPPVKIIGELLPGHAELIREELAGVLLLRPENNDQPIPKFNDVPVYLTDEEKEAYRQLDTHGWTRVGDEIVQTINAVSKTTRKRQMANDWNGLAESGAGAGSKVRKAAELLTTKLRDEQVVVGMAYKEGARRLAQVLTDAGHPSVLFTGDEKPAERQAAKAAFRSGEARILIGSLATMGEGVDGLQVAAQMILLDRDWTPARNEQVIARCRRRGQTQQVQVWNLFAAGTIDEDVALALEKKQTLIDQVIGS